MMSAQAFADFSAAMLAGVCIIIAILREERTRPTSSQAEQRAVALLTVALSGSGAGAALAIS